MRILIYGKTGRVGREIMERLSTEGHHVIGLKRKEADFLDPRTAVSWINDGTAELVINCVAMNGMERCARDGAEAEQINGDTPLAVARACNDIDVPMIHFSTDYVFTGSHNQAPLLETFPTDPCGTYGWSKVRGESIINWSEKNLVFRLSSIYGRAWEGPVDAVAQALRGDTPIKVLRQFCAPTSARSVANAIAQVVRVAAGRWQDFGGTYHLATTEGIWKRDFAAALLDRVFGNERKFEIVEGQLELARPIHSFLCSHKFEETFGYKLPTWSEDLEIALPLLMIADMKAPLDP